MKYYFDVTKSAAPELNNSVHRETITRHWYDNVTFALLDQAFVAERSEVGAVSNVSAVA